MSADGDRVSVDEGPVSVLHLSAGEADIRDLRVRAGMGAAGEIDSNGHAQTWKTFVQLSRDPVQGVLGLDRGKAAVSPSGAGGLVPAEGLRAQRIAGKNVFRTKIRAPVFGDIQDDQLVRVRRAQLTVAVFFRERDDFAKVRRREHTPGDTEPGVVKPRLLLFVNAVEVAPVPGFGEGAAAVRQRPCDRLNQSFSFARADVFDQVFQAAVVSFGAVAAVAKNTGNGLGHIDRALGRYEQVEGLGELWLARKAAADPDVEPRRMRRPVNSGDEGQIVDSGVSHIVGIGGEAQFVFSREISVIGIPNKSPDRFIDDRFGVEEFFRIDAHQRVAEDVPRDVPAAFNGRQADAVQCAENVRNFIQSQIMNLNALPNGDL